MLVRSGVENSVRLVRPEDRSDPLSIAYVGDHRYPGDGRKITPQLVQYIED